MTYLPSILSINIFIRDFSLYQSVFYGVQIIGKKYFFHLFEKSDQSHFPQGLHVNSQGGKIGAIVKVLKEKKMLSKLAVYVCGERKY